MALPLFALTLFVSAFILFLVQPLIGKLILPKLGGTPQVWNTCMMFFQMTLLVGYGYTHFVSTKLPLRRQIFIHCLLLFLPFLFLLPEPFNIRSWIPPAGSNPIFATLLLLAMVVGVPFFVVSTSAPLLQKWFANTGHPSANDPYFLYGASNLGSLLSLVAYPFLIEPWITLPNQAYVWTGLYVGLGALILMSAALVWKTAPRFALAGGPELDIPPMGDIPQPPPMLTPAESTTAVKAGPAPARPGIARKKGFKHPGKPGLSVPPSAVSKVDVSQPSSAEVDWKRRLRWILLAFAPSSLMLGVTSWISVDLSPFPFLWCVSLALYLLSFILVFSKWAVPWVGLPHDGMVFLGVPAVMGLFLVLVAGKFSPFVPTILSFTGFFFITMVCHGELAKDRPTTRHLTEYFLLMSVGGALGGIFNAMIAPLIFVGVVEYPIAIVVAAFLRPTLKRDGWLDEFLVNTFPGLGASVRETGDNMARSFGKNPPHNYWLLNYTLDFVLAFFVFLLTLGMRAWSTGSGVFSILTFLGLPKDTAMSWLPNARLLSVYLPAMIFVMMFGFGRAFRFGLSMAALMIVGWAIGEGGREDHQVYAGRSYFGVLRVYEGDDELRYQDQEGVHFKDPHIRLKTKEGRDITSATYTYLMHGSTYHGRNYHEPAPLRRVLTTYYHQKGPVGAIMDRYRWFRGDHGTFYADARLPVSMIGLGAAQLGIANLPIDQLAATWSEPPYATIGLGSGTMAGYGRWLQHVTFYEIDDNIRNFSLPPKIKEGDRDVINPRFLWKGKDPFFTYLTDSIHRGSKLEVIMGDARLSMAQEREEASAIYTMPKDKQEVYGKQLISAKDFPLFYKRDNYYKVIEVDAFNSDAIPIHLTVKEAIELYLSKLAPDGVLCMHTSNRHMDLVKPITDIATALNKPYVRGHDTSWGDRREVPEPFIGHFGSEYVMIANDEKYLLGDGKQKPDLPQLGGVILKTGARLPDDTAIRDALRRGFHVQEWDKPRAPGMRLWTDDFSNIVSILR